MRTIQNGMPWRDAAGEVLHAHGGGFLEYEGYWYWYGEDRRGENRVACYRSQDLVTWEFCAVSLHLDSPTAHHYVRADTRLVHEGQGANIERPKVLYCAKTGKFVMWMHYENGRDYNDARCAVAVCDTPDGDFTYLGSFNPVGNMARDCTLFLDDDGTAYFVASARDNADMICYRLSEDFLAIDEQVKVLWPGQFREAPAIFKRGKYYFMLTSQCTGWEPNQGAYAYAESLTGRWSPLIPFGDVTTFNTQPTYVLPVHDTYLYVGDRWDPSAYENSGYVMLPITFSDEHTCAVRYGSTLDLDTMALSDEAAQTVRIVRTDYRTYLAGNGEHVFGRRLAYADENLLWTLEYEGGAARLRHSTSGRYLSCEGVLAADDASDRRQWWHLEPRGEAVLLVSDHSRKSLIVQGRRVILTDESDRQFGGYYITPNL